MNGRYGSPGVALLAASMTSSPMKIGMVNGQRGHADSR